MKVWLTDMKKFIKGFCKHGFGLSIVRNNSLTNGE